MPTRKKTLSVRVDPKLARRLEKLARETDRSVSWHATKALNDYASMQEYMRTEIRLGLEEARRGELTDLAEVKAEMERHLARFAHRRRPA
jgi:predicted transcriptional regulator